MVDVTVKVWAVTNVGRGTRTEHVIPVSPGAPIHANESHSIPLTKGADVPLDDDKTMIAVLLPKTFLCNNINGKPDKWGVIVAEASQATETSFVGSIGEYESHKSNYYGIWSKVIDETNRPPYLATDSAWIPACGEASSRRRQEVSDLDTHLIFIVGTEHCLSNQMYCNGPLQLGKAYRVKSYACTTTGCTETLYSLPIWTGSFFPI
ncbi:uncharacterized protein LOC127852559 [Dreissena polymorpha]|uniref:uncharacterized protein LOC127852559 n=1 Tax=Dreissena polymorpha TaxID=45954 RepID=UPI0022645459|nr:uncharacterized protein LOC127852559 [Dreissena polymorpha]